MRRGKEEEREKDRRRRGESGGGLPSFCAPIKLEAAVGAEEEALLLPFSPPTMCAPYTRQSLNRTKYLLRNQIFFFSSIYSFFFFSFFVLWFCCLPFLLSLERYPLSSYHTVLQGPSQAKGNEQLQILPFFQFLFFFLFMSIFSIFLLFLFYFD